MSQQAATASPLISFPPIQRWAVPLLVIGGAAYFAGKLGSLSAGRNLALSLWLGLFFGALLQRSRFCFYCVSRDFIESRNAKGLLGIVACLAVGTLGYHILFGAFLPEPAVDRLPPNAHIGPVSWVLAAGALAFGFGMALSGSCISAQFYRLGEGVLSAPFALLGTLLGFVLGFLSWNTLYLQNLQEAPLLWLPHHLGYGGSIALQLGLLGVIALILAKLHRQIPNADAILPWWRRRWPTYAGGILIGALAVAAFLRIAPLGVTAELGSIARTLANHASLLPERLEGLDTLRGCATVVKETIWSNNGLFVIGLVSGSFAAAWSAGDFALRLPTPRESLRVFSGGVLMGWGSMVALGCTVGTLLSGIMAAAVSGWVFALFCAVGLYLGWRLRQQKVKALH
jgi:uncharacterized membrane protein YedE/YeeE